VFTTYSEIQAFAEERSKRIIEAYEAIAAGVTPHRKTNI
jgi:hypothetical protein